MKTKLHLIIMSLVLLFMAGGQSVCLAADTWSYPTTKPETPFGGGDGSWADPYRIETAQHLANLAYMVNETGSTYKGKYFVMTNDITLTDDGLNAMNTDRGKLWRPIGTYYYPYSRSPFCGNFNGLGHTIKGIKIQLTENKTSYGLFGYTDGAIIENINMEDCNINETYKDLGKSRVGILCGQSNNTMYINCNISGSSIKSSSSYNCIIGGMVGYVTSDGETLFSNCKFDGNINVVTFGDYDNDNFVGGLVGQTLGRVTMKNCSAGGKIEVCFAGWRDNTYVGGFCGELKSGGSMRDCVCSTKIYFDSELDGICNAYLSGFTYGNTENQIIANNCAFLGEINVGDEDRYPEFNELYVSSFGGKATVIGSAFYGKFNIYGNAVEAYIAPVTNRYVMNSYYKQNVVYSEENAIEVLSGKLHIDEVCNSIEGGKRHRDYYYFGLLGETNVDCVYTANQFLYAWKCKEVEGDDLIKTLNNDAGAYIWGKFTGMKDECLNDLPLPLSCGGDPVEYNGDGTSEVAAFTISTEDELKKLMEAVNGGNDFEGKYFKLGSDIYMTGTMDKCIGTYDHPFKGHFNGNGHAIIGLRKSLFGYMYGTVKNLSLVDCNIWESNNTTALARYVGDENNKAEVSNCYVSGSIAFSTPWDQLGYASSFAIQLAKGSSIHDCYFKGTFVVKQQTMSTHNVAGIAIYDNNRSVNTSTESPQGIFNCYASFDVKEEASNWEPRYTYGISNDLKDYSTGNYFVCSDYRLSESYNGGTKLKSESELNEKYMYMYGWSRGLYRPVLKGTKNYEATLPDGGTTYLDAIPEQKPLQNYIVNVNVGDDPYADKLVWQLPNTAVYVASEQADYILNCRLDQSAELKYKRTKGALSTRGQLRFSLTQNDKGAHFVCLPGEVLKSDLPEGSDAMIVGKVTVVNDEEQVNVVHVDTIPAGVPCFLYVPVTSVKSGNNIDMLMRSGIVSEPVMNADYSSFKGTFSPQTVSEQACLDVAKETFTRAATRGAAQVEDAYYFIRGNEDAEVKPFSAWIESSLGNVRIVDYLLLDEYSQTNEELIENSTDDVNIKLRLTMDADKWTTVCLPFDMGIDEIKEKFGEDTKLEEIESISYDGTTLNIRLKEATDGIVTGYPYFIKPSAGNSIFDLGPRILSNELSEDGYMAISSDATRELSLKLGGAYGMSILSSAEDYNAYYFTDGTLIQVPFGTPFTLGGFRCWFKASDATTSAPAELTSVVITHSDGTLTDISVVAKDPQATKQTIYDLRGVEKKSGKGIAIKNGIKVTQLSEVNIPW